MSDEDEKEFLNSLGTFTGTTLFESTNIAGAIEELEREIDAETLKRNCYAHILKKHGFDVEKEIEKAKVELKLMGKL